MLESKVGNSHVSSPAIKHFLRSEEFTDLELKAIIKKYFSHVKTEHSPKWLGQQRYDIYIPSKKVAIEYQGQQHYEPISFFGGEKGFQKTLLRDKKKLEISQNNGIDVLYWNYNTKINESTVQKFLQRHNLI